MSDHQENIINDETRPDCSQNSQSEEENSSEELQKMLEQKKQLEIQQVQERRAEEEEAEEAAEKAALQKKMEEHMENTANNFNIFLTWIKQNLDDKNLYKSFSDNFTSEFKIELYEGINEFFNDEWMVTDDVLFYWKFMVVTLMRSSRKYKSYIDDLIFDLKTRDTNVVLVKEKHIFRCFVADEPICYFKENGNDYYVS